MKSSVVKRSLVINGHKTSVSLEDAFWADLKTIARNQQATLAELVTKIDRARERGNLSSAVRVFVLQHFRNGKTAVGSSSFNGERRRVPKRRPVTANTEPVEGDESQQRIVGGRDR